jgi:predicted permease
MAVTTAMLSIGSAVLLRPPPVVEPERMVSVWELRSSSYTSMEGQLLSYARYEAYRTATGDVFEGLAGHAYRDFGLVTDDGAVRVNGFVTSGNYFALLGLVPELGRLYDSDDDASVVLSERMWRSRFGADPTVVGRAISIAGDSYVVAGVAPVGFSGTMSMFGGDLWVPAGAYARLNGLDPESVVVVPIGRLGDGVERGVAEERVAAVARSIAPADPTVTVRGARFDRLQWRGDNEAILTAGLGVLVTTAVLVLLVACANIAAMTTARSHDRRREVAVRRAIGAGSGRLLRQLLTESMVLAAAGGAGGVLLAYWGTALLSSMEFPVGVTIALDATPDGRVLAASFAVAGLTGLLFGLGPALRSATGDLTASLKGGAHSPRLSWRKNAFVVGQVAIATLLLVVAGLFTRSFGAIANVPLGFVPESVQVASLSLAGQGYSEREGRAFYDAVLGRVRALPSVEGAGLARWVLLGGGNSNRWGSPVGGVDGTVVDIEYNSVDPGWADATGVELVEGRFFTEDDAEGAPRVAVINQTLAARFWPGASAIGRSFRTDDVEHRVVGVVANGVYVTAVETPTAYSFHPLAQDYRPTVALHVRTGMSDNVAAQVRDVVRGIDPDIALGEWRTMEEVVSVSRFGPAFIAWLSTLFAAIGLGLAAIGVYGLLAVQVAQRGREFGVRMALGAKARDVLLLVLGRGARVAALGCVLGLVLSGVAARWVTSLVYHRLSPYDLVTWVLVPATLMVAVALASTIPARRATRVSPAATLREE